jgi:hypothetical protein
VSDAVTVPVTPPCPNYFTCLCLTAPSKRALSRVGCGHGSTFGCFHNGVVGVLLSLNTIVEPAFRGAHLNRVRALDIGQPASRRAMIEEHLKKEYGAFLKRQTKQFGQGGVTGTVTASDTSWRGSGSLWTPARAELWGRALTGGFRKIGWGASRVLTFKKNKK